MAEEKHSTLSFKLDNDFRDEVKKMLDESPMNNKDWFAKAVQLMKVQSMKENSTDFASDLGELEVHTARIFELVSNMVQRSVVLRESAVRELETKLEQQREITANFQLKIKESIEEKKQALNDLETSQKEQADLEKQLDELRETLETNKLLINEYKEKNDTLNGLVTKYQSYATENDQLKETLDNERSSHQSKIDDLTQQNNKQSATIKELEQQMNTLTESHDTAVERLNERRDVEQEKALLALERTHQKALTEANNEYSNKLKELYEEMTNQRKTYEQKIDALQQELNTVRTTKNTRK